MTLHIKDMAFDRARCVPDCRDDTLPATQRFPAPPPPRMSAEAAAQACDLLIALLRRDRRRNRNRGRRAA